MRLDDKITESREKVAEDILNDEADMIFLEIRRIIMGKILELDMLMPQLEQLFRIMIAGGCGAAIGAEREWKHKTAGLRTHVIVAVSSALMIILSKYGFQDVLSPYVRLDPSRIAAGAVTAIGFLGSGVIFSRNRSVSGITTSAGIWATVGVGMSIGAGMYQIGIATTGIIILVEIFLGRSGKSRCLTREIYQIVIEYEKPKEADRELMTIIRTELEEKYQCSILKFQIKCKDETVRAEVLVKTKNGNELIQLAKLVENYPEIIKISM